MEIWGNFDFSVPTRLIFQSGLDMDFCPKKSRSKAKRINHRVQKDGC